jgi:uncharacterized protein HemX
MMPFLALLANPLVRKVVMYGLLALAVAAGIAWFVHHERAIGAAKIEAAVKAATEAEHQRRDQVIADARREADQAAERIARQDAKYANLMQQIARLSAAHDRQSCLDRDAIGRLRAIGGDRRQAGNGARQPAR